MKTMVALPVLVAGLSIASGALAQTAGQSAPPTAPPSAPPVATGPTPQAEASEAAAQGQWVDTDRYGWVWVPAGGEATTVSAQPYAYLYAPTYGWTWVVSPWGFGPFRPGPWIHARGPWIGPTPYRYYAGPRVWYGHHGVAPHPLRPSFGAHWGVAAHARGNHR